MRRHPRSPLLIVGVNHPSSRTAGGDLKLLLLLPHPVPLVLVVGLPVAFVWQGREQPSLRPLDGPGRESPPLLPLVGLGHELPPLQSLVGGVVSRPPLQPLDERGREPPPLQPIAFYQPRVGCFTFHNFSNFGPAPYVIWHPRLLAGA